MMSNQDVKNLTTNEFLRAIVPQGYTICLSSQRTHPNPGRPKKPWSDRFYNSQAEKTLADSIATACQHDDTNQYFGIAGFRNGTNRRKADNAEAIQTLFIDADLKAGFKDRSDIAKSLQALRQAVPELPPAWVVDSGNGLHIYYAFTKAEKIPDWLAVAHMLVRVATAVDDRLMADSQCTVDAARVARLPGTHNAKTGDRKLCHVVRAGGSADFQDIKDGLIKAATRMKLPLHADTLSGDIFPNAAERPLHLQSPPTDQVFGKGLADVGHDFHDLDFKPIVRQCNQMKDMLLHPDEVDYHRWLLALRVISTVKNPKATACKFSEGHPEYSRSNTLYKLREVTDKFDAPTAYCKEFKECSPKQCRGCPIQQEVVTPSQIPLRIQEKEELQQAKEEAQDQAAADAEAGAKYLSLPVTVKHRMERGREYTSLPVDRGKQGVATEPCFDAHLSVLGCSDRVDVAMSNRKEILRTGDRHVHLDVTFNNHVNTVAIPTSELGASHFDTATKTLNAMGLSFPRDQAAKKAVLEHLSDLIRISGQRAGRYRPKKGWRKAGRRGEWEFVAGARTFKPDGSVEENYTVAEHLSIDADALGLMERVCPGVPKGRINLWQQGMSVYSGQGSSVAQLLLLSGLSNLLFPLMSEDKGGIVLTLTGQAGRGKTTLLKFLASFTGPYDKFIIPGSSTENALGSLLKQANCMMLPVDDTIQQNAETFSALLTLVSGGAEKVRMSWDSQKGGSTPFEEGFNASLLMTSNYSSGDVIGSGGKHQRQMQTEAARSRTLEVPARLLNIPGTTAEDWRRAEHLIAGNYGQAAERFLTYVVSNQVVIYNALSKAELHYRDKLSQGAPPEKRALVRFWARWLSASAITARLVCNKLNLLPWSSDAIAAAGVELAKQATLKAEKSQANVMDAFWLTFKETMREDDPVNRRHFVVEHEHRGTGWHIGQWTKRVRVAKNRDGQAAVGAITSGMRYSIRTDITDQLDAKGKPVERHRSIFIQILELKDWVARHKGERLPVADWSDLYGQLLSAGAEVLGVEPEEPNVLAGPGGQVQIDISETASGGSGYRTKVVEIRFPRRRLS